MVIITLCGFITPQPAKGDDIAAMSVQNDFGGDGHFLGSYHSTVKEPAKEVRMQAMLTHNQSIN